MKIRKNVLADTLKVFCKVVSQTSPVEAQRSVRFLGIGEQIWLTATDGVESVVVEVIGDAEGVGDFAVEYRALRELRGKLRLLLDETGSLTRKVKEAVLKQKQKERDFVQARRAIERIKMAI